MLLNKQQLEKIAVSLGYTTGLGGSPSLSRNSTYRTENNNYQDTLSESRTNADLQPMNRKISKPLDFPAAKTKTKKNRHLSHLNDKRMSNTDRPRVRTQSTISSGSSVI